MRESVQQAFAVVAALLLVVSAIGVVAYVGGDQYSPAQNVSAAARSGTIDDFESGDLTVEASGWGDWAGDNGSFSADSSDPIAGSFSGLLVSDGTNKEVTTTADSSETPSRIALKVRRNASTGGTTRLRLKNGGTGFAQIILQNGGDIEYRESTTTDSGADWYTNTIVKIELLDIDYSSDTYDLYVDGDQVVDDASFSNSVSGVDTIGIFSDSSDAFYVDDIEIGGSNYSITTSTGTLATFEDGTTVTSDGWSGIDDGGGRLSTTGDSLNGQQSGFYDVTTTDSQPVNITSTSGEYSPNRIAFAVEGAETTSNALADFEVKNDGNLIFNFHLEGSSDLKSGDGASMTDLNKDWYADTKYYVEIRDIDWNVDTYDVWVNGEKLGDDLGFWSSASGFDRIEISSRSTTDTNFTIDNIEVGNDPFGETIFSNALVEDFEDGDTQIETSGYNNPWLGDSGSLSTTTGTVLKGSTSGKFTVDSDDKSVYVAPMRRSNVSRVEAHIQLSADTGNSNDFFILYLNDHGGFFTQARFDDSTNAIKYHDGAGQDTGVDWSPGVTYNVTFADINFTSNTFDFYINGTRHADDASFNTGASGIEDLRFRQQTSNGGVSRTVYIDNVESGSCDNCDFTPSDLGTTTSSSGGGSSSKLADDEYWQTFILNSSTPTIQTETATITGAYWTRDGERAEVSDETNEAFGQREAPPTVDLRNTDFEDVAFNFQDEARAVAHDGSIYDLVVEDEACGGWWRTSAFIGDEDAGDETLQPDSGLEERIATTTCAVEDDSTPTPWPTDEDLPTVPPTERDDGSPGTFPSDPVTPIPTITPSLPDPTLNVNVVESAFDDCWQVHVSYYDPSASTTEISYDFTADGEAYSDTITFDDPIALFSDRIHQAKFDPDINESDCQSGAEPPDVGDGNVSFVFEDGETGSLAFDQAQFEPDDSGIGPVVPGGDEDGGTPWWVLAGVVGVGALGVRRFSPETFNTGAQAARGAATRAVAAAPGVVSALGRVAGRLASATAAVVSRWRR